MKNIIVKDVITIRLTFDELNSINCILENHLIQVDDELRTRLENGDKIEWFMVDYFHTKNLENLSIKLKNAMVNSLRLDNE